MQTLRCTKESYIYMSASVVEVCIRILLLLLLLLFVER